MKTFQQIREEHTSLVEETGESLGTLAARSSMGGRVSGPTHKKIVAKHGEAVSAAVKKHAEIAHGHDNGMASSNAKKHHQEFVKKHLGGVGSKDHKDYKKYMHNAGMTKKNTGMDLHHE